MPRFYGYARVSRLDQVKGQSPEVQTERIRQYYEFFSRTIPGMEFGSEGWRGTSEPGSETTDGFFVDEGVSAFKIELLDRPAGRRVHQLLQPGDHLAFAFANRGYRSVYDLEKMIRVWKKRDIHAHFLDLGVNLSTPHGVMMMQLVTSFAQFESARKSELVRASHDILRKQRRPINQEIPVGSRLVQGPRHQILVPVPEDMRIIGEVNCAWRTFKHLISLRGISHAIEGWFAYNAGRQLRPMDDREWSRKRIENITKGITRFQGDEIEDPASIRWLKWLPPKRLLKSMLQTDPAKALDVYRPVYEKLMDYLLEREAAVS